MDHLPMGLVFDQIACYQIARCGAEEKRIVRGSLMEQMDGHYRK